MSMTVIDLFCGCGGISLGFALAGFDVTFGLDNNKDAIASFSHNFPNAKTLCKKIEDLNDEDIPISDVIVGGPPCVNFSSSKGNRANVLEGLKLVQLFLKFVYERKPKYWIMENVPRIGLHLPEQIPLRWIGVDKDGFLEIPSKKLFDIWEYGAPQKRSRLLIGNYPIPNTTHRLGSSNDLFLSELKPCLTLGDILNSFPDPVDGIEKSKKVVEDPIYDFEIPIETLDDHFYDSRMSETEVSSIRDAKENHPFMGRMGFPDDPQKLSRTVVSLQMGRETIVVSRNKEYRRLTIRECASIQTFPISFKFAGNTIESRYRQAGNAVPPILTYRIGNCILASSGIESVGKPRIYIPESLNVPVPRKKKPRKIDYSRSRKILFPGKELRGFRIELISTRLDLTEWKTVIHLGEGKLNHRTMEIQQLGAEIFVRDNLLAYGHNLYEIFQSMINDLNNLEIDSGTELHDQLHDSYGIIPEKFTKILGLFELYLPKEKWADFEIPIVNDNLNLDRKRIRIRLLVALAISKQIETRLNNSEIKAARNSA